MTALRARDAASLVVTLSPRQPAVRMAIADAGGHVLAEAVYSRIPLPPWTNASMDGFAVHGDDVGAAASAGPITLEVVGEVAAGAQPERTLQRGEAMRIFTGAPLPPGADSVIRQEDTDRGTLSVKVFADRDVRANVRFAGGDLASGAVALEAGTELHPAALGLLAALGEPHVMVYRRPRVGILCTGDEIVPADQVEAIRSGARLGDVNSVALGAMVHAAGGVVQQLGLVRDDLESLCDMVSAALDVDLVITAGGVSVGDHDHIRGAMAALGATVAFDRVLMRPGGPATCATLPDGRLWLALPGNPVSAMVTFDLFGRTAIRAMAGLIETQRPSFPVALAAAVQPDQSLDLYLRCTFTTTDQSRRPTATLTGPQGSGMLMSMVRAAGLICIPSGREALPADSVVLATHLR